MAYAQLIIIGKCLRGKDCEVKSVKVGLYVLIG